MNLFTILLFTSVSIIMAFLIMFMFWYNGVLEVKSDDDGDNLKLNINEYDMIKKRSFMIILIKRNK